MPQGLPVSRLINVDVVLTPLAAQAPNLNSCLIVGSSDVINVTERIRSYASIEDVAADFGTGAQEYEAAALFFGQLPQPNQLYIGRWAEAATHGLLLCGALTATEQEIATWNAIADAEFKIAINGGAVTNIGPIDFSGAANLNAVAADITTALTTAVIAATCTWDALRNRFMFETTAAAAGDTVAFLTAGAADTDIHSLLKGTAVTGATQVNGIAAETAVAAVTILDNLSQYWYLLTFASTTMAAAADNASVEAVAAYIEAASNKHIYGQTSTDVNCLDPASVNDIMFLLKALGYTRSFAQYSANANAVASWMGRAVTVNFNGNNTVLTMMYKGEPGVVPESLTSNQADALKAKNGNVFVNYNNNTSILQYGTMASGNYFDEIQNLDWLANDIQTTVFNLLYTSATKIPQTDAGNHLIANAIEGACQQAVANGTLAPGQWNANGFGQLQEGDFLNKGYYIYVPPIYLQSQADREARKSVPFQIAAKLAGAVQTVDVILNVNR